jgi:hypothetical protein
MGEDRLVADPLLERRGFRTDGPRGRGGVVIRDRFRPYPRIKQLPRERDRGFESAFLQRRVCELSVPLLSRPEGDVRGIGFQTVRTYIAIGNSEARGAGLLLDIAIPALKSWPSLRQSSAA